MSLFGKKKRKKRIGGADAAALALRSLDFINEAVLVIDSQGMIKFANPAASAMTGFGEPDNVTGLDYALVLRLEDAMGNALDPAQTDLYTAIHLNKALHTREYTLVSAQSEKRIVLDLTCIPTGDDLSDRIVTFRDITNEVAEEREQAEFISTASHEMRTPVASIEGYLGLALNPQTATIDERAKKYLEAAHASSQHLGKLFRDLLDVTKFDDDRAKMHLIPVDAIEAVSRIADEQSEAIKAKHIKYFFGQTSNFMDKKHLAPKLYMAVDYDFLREIVNNLLGNAIKYTPDGGEIKIAVRGDSDQVIIAVADNGIGIPSDDLGHVFQKFYRVDNSQTRQIGGTGLGLYLVKRRAEAMGGHVWAESDFGHGSTFYVSLPRITESEYEKMRIAYGNEKMMRTPFVAPVVGTVALTAQPVGSILGQTATEQPAGDALERTVAGRSSIKIQPLGQASTAEMPATSSVAQGRQMLGEEQTGAAGDVQGSGYLVGAQDATGAQAGYLMNKEPAKETPGTLAGSVMSTGSISEVPMGSATGSVENNTQAATAGAPQILSHKPRTIEPLGATATSETTDNPSKPPGTTAGATADAVVANSPETSTAGAVPTSTEAVKVNPSVTPALTTGAATGVSTSPPNVTITQNQN